MPTSPHRATKRILALGTPVMVPIGLLLGALIGVLLGTLGFLVPGLYIGKTFLRAVTGGAFAGILGGLFGSYLAPSLLRASPHGYRAARKVTTLMMLAVGVITLFRPASIPANFCFLLSLELTFRAVVRLVEIGDSRSYRLPPSVMQPALPESSLHPDETSTFRREFDEAS